MIDESLLDRIPVLAGLDGRARRELAARSVVVRRDVGACFWRAGDTPKGMLVLLEGRVRLVRTGPNGRRQVIHKEGNGVILGEVSLLDGDGYPATAEAEERSVAILITPEALDAALAADPRFAQVLLANLARRVRHLVERVESLTTLDVRARLARHLLDRSEATDGDFDLGVTQAALAEELGTVREVVVRNLAMLRRRRILESAGRGRLRVLNRASLRTLAGS